MKTTLKIILFSCLFQLGNNLNAQHLKLSEVSESLEISSLNDSGGIAFGKWSYSELDAQFTYYENGRPITNTMKLPIDNKKISWFLTRAGYRIYFAYSTYEDQTYTLYLAPYNYKTNQFGEIKMVLQTKSESNPAINVRRPTSTSNNDYFLVKVGTGKSDAMNMSYGPIVTNTAVSIVDYELNILYNANMPRTYTSKEFNYDVENALGSDGSWYRFGIKYEGEADAIKGTYGGFITTPDGNSSEFISINVDGLGFVSSVDTKFENGKIIQYGTWSKQPEVNEMSGTFYLELSTVDLKVLHFQIKTIATPELTSYCINNLDSKIVEKRESINSIKQISTGKEKLQFANGKLVTVLKRENSTGGHAYNLSAFFIATFGPKPEDMSVQMVRIDQRTPSMDPTYKGNRGVRVGFELGISMLNNNLIVIFNDNIANAGVISSGKVQTFKPYPGDTETIATFALIMNDNCKINREQILSYSTDKLLFHEIGARINNESIFIYTVNDTDYDYLNSKHDNKISPRVVQFVK